MRLSEAMLLGSTIVHSMPGRLGEAGGPGCALGMALEAMGQPREYDQILFHWPWTQAKCRRLPCGCAWRTCIWDYKVRDAICHVFDVHVSRRRDWTLEQLSAWVASIEPGENVEEGNKARREELTKHPVRRELLRASR